MSDELPEIPIVTPVAHTAEQAPAIAIHTAEQTAEIPPALLAESFHTLATAINRLSDVTERSLEKTQEVVETPAEASAEESEDIAPEVVDKPDRYIRRNGRRVKRA